MTEDRDLQVLLETRYLRVLRRASWEFVERPGISGIVVVVPLTAGGELVLVEQFRVPVGAPVIELPAGLADVIDGRDEPLEDAARRELLEETGYQAGDLLPLFHGPPSPGITSEVVTFFLAPAVERVAAGGGNQHEQEKIRVHVVPLEHVESWLAAQAAEGKLVDVKIYAGLYAARR